MEKVYLFDDICGEVYKCMYAGLDKENSPIWINITPGCAADNIKKEIYNPEKNTLIFLASEHEVVGSDVVAFVLARSLERSPIKSKITYSTLRSMKSLGMQWNKEPLDIYFNVCCVENRYNVFFEDDNSSIFHFVEVEGFEDIDDVYKGLRHFVLALAFYAGISVSAKLIIKKGMKKDFGKSRLAFFDEVMVV
jgi:hypothetical protein